MREHVLEHVLTCVPRICGGSVRHTLRAHVREQVLTWENISQRELTCANVHSYRLQGIYGVATISKLLKFMGLFCENSLFYRALLQKRPIILRSLLIVATPYLDIDVVTIDSYSALIQRTYSNVCSYCMWQALRDVGGVTRIWTSWPFNLIRHLYKEHMLKCVSNCMWQALRDVGGIYMDMDVVTIRPYSALMKNHQFVMGQASWFAYTCIFVYKHSHTYWYIHRHTHKHKFMTIHPYLGNMKTHPLVVRQANWRAYVRICISIYVYWYNIYAYLYINMYICTFT